MEHRNCPAVLVLEQEALLESCSGSLDLASTVLELSQDKFGLRSHQLTQLRPRQTGFIRQPLLLVELEVVD